MKCLQINEGYQPGDKVENDTFWLAVTSGILCTRESALGTAESLFTILGEVSMGVWLDKSTAESWNCKQIWRNFYNIQGVPKVTSHF